MRGLRFLLLLLFASAIPVATTGQIKYILPEEEFQSDIKVLRGEIEGCFTLSHFFIDTLSIKSTKYIRVSIPGALSSGAPGTPELPAFSSLVEADPSSGYQTVVLSVDSTIIDLDTVYPSSTIFPAQPSVRKGTSSAERIFIDQPVSGSGPVKREPLIKLVPEGIMRGIPIARVQFNPMHYDVAHNRLIIYHSLDFKLVPEQYTPPEEKLQPAPFKRAFSMVIRDKYRVALKRLVMDEPVTMVILSDSMFQESLQPLVQWKTEKGFNIIEAYTSDSTVGSTYQEIRDFMSSVYHHPPDGIAPPSYLLIVGDVEHVPLSQPSGQITDLYYTTFDGEGDYLPEMFHGRISVKSDEELNDVVDKILMYEKFQFPDPSFLDRTILIAGYDGSYGSVHGNGQINYAANNYFNEENGIDANVYLHPAAASMDQEILEDISAGAALVNYTGHGEYYGWLDPAFRLHHLDTLKNINKFGLMIGNGCSTNQFNMNNDCFAEVVVKVKEGGAVGYIGCTNDSYWDEDYYWTVGIGPFTSNPGYHTTTSGYYDKLFHLGNEPVEEWAPSLGEMIFAGNMTVQQSESNRKKYYWEIYQIMGDPSLVPWFRLPENAPVHYPKSIPADATQVSIRASAYDYIALLAEGILINALHADRYGQAYISIPDTLMASDLKLVVTGDYRRPMIDTIFRTASSSGYLEMAGYQLNAESVGPDGLVSAGESFSLDLRLVNRGDTVFGPGTLVMGCLESFIAISDSTVAIGSIHPGDTAMISTAFRLTVGHDAEDMVSFTLGLHKQSEGKGNTIYLKETVYAPVLASLGITWEDITYGNGNGKIDPGEKIRFRWEMENRGSFRSDSIYLSSAGSTGAVFEAFSVNAIPGIPVGEGGAAMFSGTIKESASDASPIWLGMQGEGNKTLSDSLFLVIGRHYEDFSTGDLSRFRWVSLVEGWGPDSTVFSGAPWSLRSAEISHNAFSSVQIEVEVGQVDSLLFDYKVSSEKNYDFLKFYLDSMLIDEWSGNTGWKRHVQILDPGKHLLEWRYQKDLNTTNGEDAAWIDNVVFPANSFDSIDMGIYQLKGPVSSKSLGDAETLQILVVNAGSQQVTGFFAGYSIGGSEWVEHYYSDTVLPGDIFGIELPGTFDMSELGSYVITAGIRADGDVYPGNDTLSFLVQHYVFPDLALMSVDLDSDSSLYADLIVNVTNEGNIPAEELYYTYYLNDELRKMDTATIGLLPGGSTELTIRLIGEGDQDLENGWHDFLIVAEKDSVVSNNMVSGTVFWSVQSIGESEKAPLMLFPNPATAEFTIRLPDYITAPVTIEFVTLSGRVTGSERMNQSQQTFNAKKIFAADGAGIYLVVIRGNQGEVIATGKLRVADLKNP
ncbi:MAG: C25 family cysteine peptidase [Bacteroidales bacterium]